MRSDQIPARPGGPARRGLKSRIPAPLRRGLVIFVLLLVIEYLVIPELVGARKDLSLLGHLNIGWMIAGLVLEVASLFCYALLTRVLLPPAGQPRLSRLFRIDLAAAAVAHVIPAGTVGSAGIGYRLFTAEGIAGTDAGVMMATKGMGSTVVLNALLWLSLVISIPLAGFHPIYVSVAIVGAVALFLVAALAFGLTRGEGRASRIVHAIGRRIPGLDGDQLERLFLQIGTSVRDLARDRAVLTASLTWASLNWLLDAASLWCFVAAFGSFVNPAELFAAYGIANVIGVLPITPGGLGVIDSTAPLLLVSFGLTRSVATLGVLAWRLVNFWLPIPAGAAAYVSLKVPRGGGLKGARHAVGELMSRSGVRAEKHENSSERAGAGRESASVEPSDGDLVQQQPDGRGHGNRDQRADDPEQHGADQDRYQADDRGHLDGAAHDPGHDEVVLGQPVGDVEGQRGDGHRQRYGQRDEGHHGAADG
jgi:uncharacterized protein (TIRG00374 family)